MNILTDAQAAERRLMLPPDGILSGTSADFRADLQIAGAFVEYNQQVIVPAGASVEYVSCIVAGGVTISRMDSNYAKAQVAMLGAGHWFGEASLFVRSPSAEEIFADGEVILWTMPPETLRRICFEEPEGVQLLYNIGVLLAQKLTSQSQIPVAAAAQPLA